MGQRGRKGGQLGGDHSAPGRSQKNKRREERSEKTQELVRRGHSIRHDHWMCEGEGESRVNAGAGSEARGREDAYILEDAGKVFLFFLNNEFIKI